MLLYRPLSIPHALYIKPAYPRSYFFIYMTLSNVNMVREKVHTFCAKMNNCTSFHRQADERVAVTNEEKDPLWIITFH